MSDSNLLFVEGTDDEHVFYALLNCYQLPQCFKIKNKGGIENLLGTLPTELTVNSELERLGIVVDADTNIETRWKALQNILRKLGSVEMPITPDPNGTIVTVEQPDRTLIVGIWVMPDNMLPGMLEDFVSFLVPTGDSLWIRAGDCLAQIPEPERRFSIDHYIKAHLHTWLAWQEEPGRPLGQAITRRYLNATAPHAQQFVNWLKRLFDLV